MSKLEKFASDFHEKWKHDQHGRNVPGESDDSSDEVGVVGVSQPLTKPELRNMLLRDRTKKEPK